MIFQSSVLKNLGVKKKDVQCQIRGGRGTKDTSGAKGSLKKKKKNLDREIAPISSDTTTIGLVSEHLDREYWLIFLSPCLSM